MFAAILSTDGRPVDTRALAGPPGPALRIDIVGERRRVALIASTADAAIDGEFRSIERLGERFFLVGRLRLDARDELRGRLEGVDATVSDGALCLQAYAKWGERFLDFLSGDFCFALWDDAQGILLAARDQLGVRALFHATLGPCRVVSDSLDWLATRPGLDPALDDLWVADFLCRDRNLDLHRTIRRDIARLPPAHLLRLSGVEEDRRRYWRLTVEEPLHLRERRLYGERFRELMARAVADRLPRGRIGISMSGGLDSTTLAAFAVESAGAGRVVAQCDHFEWLMPDHEAHFSTLAARHLGIELRLSAIDNTVFDPAWRTRALRFAEPSTAVIRAEFDRRLAAELARLAPVWLYGEGPDNALVFERGAYFSWLARRFQWSRMAEAAWLYLAAMQPADWRATARRYLRPSPALAPPPLLPPWIDPSLAARLRLEERLREHRDVVDRTHGWHPRAMGAFGHAMWQEFLRDRAQDESWAPFVWRHPYFDLRVLAFLLSVPPVPWARGKLLMREAMQGRLPEEILQRPKSPLAGSPLAGPLGRGELGALSSSGRLGGYVDVSRVPAVLAQGSDAEPLLAVHALDHWLMYNARTTGVT
ncbi:MAG TPA: asparagine synthase-related protein [Reyranella sp.]|nr:asparagine synthase-related protein [Reyranella sp.]